MNSISLIRCGNVLLILLILICHSNGAISQHLQYGYDSGGNRVISDYVPMRISFNNLSDSSAIASQLKDSLGLEVYPNPTQDVVNVSIINYNIDKKVTLILSDNSGKIIQSFRITSNDTKIDLFNFPSGIYHVGILVDNRSIYYQILKND